MRFEPPSIRRTSLVRHRLIERLWDRFSVPVTVVVAPAGFGKTTLLAQAVAENRLTPRGIDCWLTCDADDVAASSFAEGLCRAVGIGPRAGFGKATAVAGEVAEAMWHRSPDEIVLMLDDVHEITEGSPGGEVLARLVAGLPGNGHVVLSGRELPPLALSRLEVQGQVLHLGEADLIFTDEELEEFAAQRQVAPSRLSESGGWPALAELAASALAGIEATYVWEEVLLGIDPDRRHDFALLAHLGVFDDELARAVLGRDADVASLTGDLPLVAATSSGGWQIHPLWRPHLAKTVSADEVAEARRRAGVALAKTGDAAAAVRLLTDAGAWGDVAGVVTDAFVAPGPPVASDVVAAWLARLPDNMTEGPLARLLGAVADMATDPAAATRNLEAAADAFRREDNPAGELACMAQLARVAWELEHPERLASLVARLFEMEALGHDEVVPLAAMGRAMIAHVLVDCETVLTELDSIPPGSLTETWQSAADALRSAALNHLGRPAEAFEVADRACGYASPLYRPLVEAVRLVSLWLLGGVDEVLHELPQLVERAATTGLNNFSACVAAYSSVVSASAGQTEQAVRYLERARHIPATQDVPMTVVSLETAEAMLAVASGDESRAAQVLDEYVKRSPPVGGGVTAHFQQLTLPLWYVLVPDCRHVWDRAALGPCQKAMRDLAKALVAVRETGRLPAGSPELPAQDVVRSMLPLPWATELALAHIAVRRQAGWALLDALWPQAQCHVRRHADDAKAPLSRPARSALARLPVPPASRLELKLLGPVELRRDGAPVDAPEWGRERVRALLGHLVLHQPVSRERVANDLWPTLDSGAQLHNLRVTLTHLLRVIEPERGERDASFLVRSHGGGLLLHRGEWLQTDIWRFDELWEHAIEAELHGLPSVALDAMQQAVALWRGDPSVLASHEWALAEIEERRLRLVRLATRAAELLLARDQPDQARHMGHLALQVDPWSEHSHHVVVAAHIASGNRRAARRALDRYRDSLMELGFSSAETSRKLEQLTRLLPIPT